MWPLRPAKIEIAMMVIESGARGRGESGEEDDEDDEGMEVVVPEGSTAAGRSELVRVFDMDFFDEESLVIVYQNMDYAEEGQCPVLNVSPL